MDSLLLVDSTRLMRCSLENDSLPPSCVCLRPHFGTHKLAEGLVIVFSIDILLGIHASGHYPLVLYEMRE